MLLKVISFHERVRIESKISKELNLDFYLNAEVLAAETNDTGDKVKTKAGDKEQNTYTQGAKHVMDIFRQTTLDTNKDQSRG